MSDQFARPLCPRRQALRWLAGFALFGIRCWPTTVVRGTDIPVGYLFAFVGGLCLFGCAFGVNVFRGGPLDMDRDQPPVGPPTRRPVVTAEAAQLLGPYREEMRWRLARGEPLGPVAQHVAERTGVAPAVVEDFFRRGGERC
jgi:hypothetical protein